MKNVIGTLVLLLLSTSLLFAQESRKKEDTKVIIRTANGTKTIENWGEDLGDLISTSFLKVFNLEDSDTDVNINISTEDDWEAFGERIEQLTTELTEGLEIEMNDLKPNDFDDDSINGFTMEEWFDEIAKREGSEVERVERLLINLRGDRGVQLRLKALLEDGSTINEERFVEDIDDNGTRD